MRAIITTLLAAGLLVVPALAGAGSHHHNCDKDHDISFSGRTSIDVEDDILVITHDAGHSQDEVLISADGTLTINGERIGTDRGDRKLLKRFHNEIRDLTEVADAIEADADRIAERSVAYAARTVAAVLRSLGGDDESDTEIDAMEADFDLDLDWVDELTDGIDEHMEIVGDLADQLRDRIDALDDLDWFMDD